MWLESSSLGAQVMLNSQVEMLNSLKFDGDVCWLGPMKQGSWISEFDPFPYFLSAFFCRVLISTGRGARWGGGARVYAWSPRLPQAGAGRWAQADPGPVWRGLTELSWHSVSGSGDCHGCSELHQTALIVGCCFTLPLMAGKWRRVRESIITKWTLPIKLCSAQSQQFFSFQTRGVVSTHLHFTGIFVRNKRHYREPASRKSDEYDLSEP